MTSLTSLPLSVFYHIRDYVVKVTVGNDDIQDRKERRSFQEWSRFVHCSQKHPFFLELRRYYSYYNLNTRYSCAYLIHFSSEEGYSPDALMREDHRVIDRLRQSCANPRQQIILSFSGSFSSSPHLQMKPFSSYQAALKTVFGIRISSANLILTIDDLKAMASLQYIHLAGCTVKAKSLAALQGGSVRLLDLRYCPSIISTASSLGGIDPHQLLEVDLSYCSSLSDVKPLAKVRKLRLEGCQEIVDVSPLHQVYDLHLAYCKNIKEVSSLSRVYRLNIDECSKIEDLSKLTHNRILSIKALPNLKRGLPRRNKLRELTITEENLSMITRLRQKNKKHLILSGDITATNMSDCQTLLRGYTQFTFHSNNNLSPLLIELSEKKLTIKRLRLDHCYNLSTIKNLSSLESLQLASCTFYCSPGSDNNHKTKHSVPKIDFASLPVLKEVKLLDIVWENMTISGTNSTSKEKSRLKSVVIENCSMDSIAITHYLEELTISNADSSNVPKLLLDKGAKKLSIGSSDNSRNNNSLCL